MAFADKMIPEATDRLTFSNFRPHDFPLVQKLNTDSQVTRYVGGVKSQPELIMSFKKYLEYHLQLPGYGYWLATYRGTNEFAGFFLVKILAETGETEIGYRLAPEFWGQGLATEGSKALVNHCFEKIGVQKVVGITHPDNMASRRVLEKSGLVFRKYDRYYQIRCAYHSIERNK